MDSESIRILEFVRDNPLCGSEGMDGFILSDLKDIGYLKAIDVTADDNNGIPEFIDIRITSYGKEALSEHYDSKQKPKTESNNVYEWHNKALGKIAIGVITGVILFFCVFLLTKHFGIT